MAEPRIFTIDEAERALPLVRRVVRDIQAEYRAWKDALARYELVAAGARGDAPEPEPVRDLRLAVNDAAARLALLLAELGTIGAELKDFEEGLVDFYALREDRLVYLCWRMDEDHIGYWHEIDAGFAGRQPVDEALSHGTVP